MTTTSYWLEEQRDELRLRHFTGSAEVAVIGGGVTGCSCALTLAERGVRVRLYEAREIAGGASGPNGGFALRGATVPYDEARAQLGPEPARRVMALTERALDRMESVAGDAFRRVGSLRLAWDEAEREALRRYVRISERTPRSRSTATRGQVLATEPVADRRYDRPHYARGGYDYWHFGGSSSAAGATRRSPRS